MTREEFIQQMWPYAQEVARETGIDPRIILAQGALESGWGRSAPGNNFFGIKGPGQALGTTEVGPNGSYRTTDNFRSYGTLGESVADYGRLLLTPRYDAVRNATGLDAQAAALGRSGYATDPNYGQKVRSIAQNIVPLGANVPSPAAAVAMAAPPAAGSAAKQGATQMKVAGSSSSSTGSSFLSGRENDAVLNMGLSLLSSALGKDEEEEPVEWLQPQIYRPDPTAFRGLLG